MVGLRTTVLPCDFLCKTCTCWQASLHTSHLNWCFSYTGETVCPLLILWADRTAQKNTAEKKVKLWLTLSLFDSILISQSNIYKKENHIVPFWIKTESCVVDCSDVYLEENDHTLLTILFSSWPSMAIIQCWHI